jgi:hypothetical protein
MKKKMESIEVSTNDRGEILIISPGVSADEQVVSITPEQVDVVVKWLQEARDELMKGSKSSSKKGLPPGTEGLESLENIPLPKRN